jgi:hypothetical protein
MKLFWTATRYFLWFFWLPLLVFFVAMGVNEAIGGDWSKNPPWLLVLVSIPMLFNLFFGPAIYSFMKKKKSRALITLINIILVLAGGFPGLLMWIWALTGKEEEPTNLPGTAGGHS